MSLEAFADYAATGIIAYIGYSAEGTSPGKLRQDVHIMIEQPLGVRISDRLIERIASGATFLDKHLHKEVFELVSEALDRCVKYLPDDPPADFSFPGSGPPKP